MLSCNTDCREENIHFSEKKKKIFLKGEVETIFSLKFLPIKFTLKTSILPGRAVSEVDLPVMLIDSVP